MNAIIDSKQIRRSTKVRIDDDPTGSTTARDAAVAEYTKMNTLSQYGVDITGVPSFTQLANDVADKLRKNIKNKPVNESYIRAIDKYLIPFFKRKPINKIDRHEIYKFFVWREAETKSEISETQRNVTNKAFSLIFDLACDLGHIKQSDIPILPKTKVKAKARRDFFNPTELKLVLRSFDGFIKESRNKKTREIRTLLQHYTNLIYGIGARPGVEVNTLQLKNILFERREDQYIWSVQITKGKTSSTKGPRTSILSDEAVKILTELVRFRLEDPKIKLREAISSHPALLLFKASYREAAPEFVKPFSQYLAYLKLDTKNHTLYSLRHTYITNHLLAKSLSRRVIAKQCGTSEEMIDNYYDHVITLDFANELKNSKLLPSVASVDLTQFYD